MEQTNFIAEEKGLNFGSVVEAIIKRSCIVDYGIIQDVVSDGVVDVALAVSRTEQDMFCMTCVLANIASSAFTLNVTPKKGDRVLVVYPRIFDDDMFTVPDGDTAVDPIINFDAKGYNLMSGIAILMNQYKEASHKNVITINENGSVEIKLDKKCELKIDDNGYLSYKTTSNADSNTKLEFTSSGMTLQDKNGCKIVTDANYTTINGKLKVKK